MFTPTKHVTCHVSCVMSRHVSRVTCHVSHVTSLASIVDYHWATAWIWVNSSSVKEGIISSPLFSLEGNPVLSMTLKDGCEAKCHRNGYPVLWHLAYIGTTSIRKCHRTKTFRSVTVLVHRHFLYYPPQRAILHHILPGSYSSWYTPLGP